VSRNPQTNKQCKVRAPGHKVTLNSQCSKSKDEFKQSYFIKTRNHTLLDFLHHLRNRYIFLWKKPSTAGMWHWTWWFAFQGRLHIPLHPKLWATRNLHMHYLLKLHCNCDAYTGLKSYEKINILLYLNIRKKKLAACLLKNIGIAKPCFATILVFWRNSCTQQKNCWFIQTLHICGKQLLKYRCVQVWIIAERWKQSTFGWYLKCSEHTPRCSNVPFFGNFQKHYSKKVYVGCNVQQFFRVVHL